MTTRRSTRMLGAVVTAAALTAAACGGGSVAAAPQAQPTAPGAAVIRLALAPDPLWDWLTDSGNLAAWQSVHNIRIEASNPFDQFSAFAGGHADIVMIDALDVPQFVAQSEREPVIVGRYTADRSFLGVRRTSQARDLAGLVEGRIAVESALGSTLLWGLIVEDLHGLDFSIDSDDFELVIVEPGSLADVVERGDVDACICIPDFSVSPLSDGTLRPLYGGRSAAEIYAQSVVGNSATRPMSQVFVVDSDWHAANGSAIAAFLELWNTAMTHWHASAAGVIADYPHLLSVQAAEDIAWIVDFVGRYDWVLPSAYIDQDDADVYADAVERMQRLGLIPADASAPTVDVSFAAGLTGE